MHHAICVDHTNKTYFIKIQSFRNHLSTDENVGFATFELFDDRFIAKF
jgi:hypothetical protein